MVSKFSQIRFRSAVATLLALSGVHAVHATDEHALSLLNPLFQDHAVVQRDQANPVWGLARPGEALDIAFAGRTIHARADAGGHWEASLPALPAGGPYTLTASSADGSQTVHDVLVGDVWLCSGQSNMVLQVKRALDARAEVQDASNDRIRMLTVDDVSSVTPLQSIPASDHWLKVTPDTVAEFSAACYFFARELQKNVPVPMGLIVAAWGGSRIEPWMSEAALRKVGGYDTSLDLLALYRKNPARAGEQWSRLWQSWWRSRPGVTNNDEPWNPDHLTETGWLNAPLELGPWQHWNKPELADFTGMLWYRTTVTLTKAQAAQHAVLNLGAVNEIDQTWVNGHWVGTGYGGGDLRAYAVPQSVLHEGKNLIAVNVLNTYRDGGIYGPASQRALRMADGSSVPLDDWQYQIVPSAYGSPPHVPWQSTSGLTTLYNGMIAPLGHYGLRGALWYQGESNTGEAASYRALLEAWRADERARFGANLPVLIAQLSSYGPSPMHPGESGWADVREAQRLVAAEDARSGLAVSVDIGERYDIHPANKQELGRRLARAARRVVYGETLAPSGPTPASAQQSGDTVTLTFDDVSEHLVAYSADNPIGFELCGAKPDSCYYAAADIHDKQVVLHARPPASSVTRVRYCWADSPICTLYDEARLPAGPFQLSISPTHSHP